MRVHFLARSWNKVMHKRIASNNQLLTVRTLGEKIVGGRPLCNTVKVAAELEKANTDKLSLFQLFLFVCFFSCEDWYY